MTHPFPPPQVPAVYKSGPSCPSCYQNRAELEMGTPALLCLSLLLWGLLGDCAAIPLMLKDKRGWTLNSAGYLLGPHAHRPLMDKGALAGKREAVEEQMQLGAEFEGESWPQSPQVPSLHPLHLPLSPPGAPAERGFQPLLDFQPSLCLPELGALDRLPLPEAASQT
ncbi:galanin peptides-like isoform X1 [Pelodiscus sinensis]|uniref:galanin peptides-like isoform X1 n=1 Tax=Pelodiscus sinensis TaxID=13735 RepID=UPI003F6BCB4B